MLLHSCRDRRRGCCQRKHRASSRWGFGFIPSAKAPSKKAVSYGRPPAPTVWLGATVTGCPSAA